MADTKFDAAWWDIWNMRRQSNKIAEEQGMEGSQVGKYRHALVTAKAAERSDSYVDPWFQKNQTPATSMVGKLFKMSMGADLNDGKTIARMMGLGNEALGFNNTFQEHLEDLGNNEIGLKIRDDVERDVLHLQEEWGLSDEQADVWRERLLRARIADAMDK